MNLHVVVAIPAPHFVSPQTAVSLAGLSASFMMAKYRVGKKRFKKDITFMAGRNRLPTYNRQIAVHFAWEKEATHMLWVNPNMAFPADALNRLLSRDEMVVAANYPEDRLPARFTAYTEGEDHIGLLRTEDDSTGLVECKYAGMGLMLTDMRVFSLIEPPFFALPVDPQMRTDMKTEEQWFCHRLQQHDIPVHVDQDLSKEVHTVGEMEFDHTIAAISERKVDENLEKSWAEQMRAEDAA